MALAAGAGCDDGAEAAVDKKPLVGVLELPLSHRHTDREPSTSTRVEIGPGEVRVDGSAVLTLDGAKITPGDRQGMSVPKLKGSFKAGTPVALVVHGATPYATLARVIYTAQQAGAKEVYFQVRKPAAPTETGWMRLSNLRFTDHSDPPVFEDAELPDWQVFTDVWQESRDGCKEDPRGDCGYVPSVKAEGGKLDMRLRSRGVGVSVRFRQYMPDGEAPPESKKKAQPEMLDGIAAPQEEEERDPSTEAQYTMRAEQATRAESPLSSIVKPVCGDHTCAAVLDAEGISMAARVVAIVGAAFPDGTPQPLLALLEPPE